MQVTRHDFNFYGQVLAGWLMCTVTSVASGTTAVPYVHSDLSPEAGGQDATTRRQHKRLETFGIWLPNSARIILIRKTPKSKVTYLFIKMADGDGRLFKQKLVEGPFPKKTKVSVSIEDFDCLKGPNSGDCLRIGAVNSPSDEPSDEIDKWFKESKFEPDTIASFRIDGFKKFASLFLDSRKGFLLLWYKA